MYLENYWPQLTLIIILVVILLFYKCYSLGDSIQFWQDYLSQTTILYISYQGRYESLSPHMNRIMQHASKVFKISRTFGIFYDNPDELDNPQKSKAIIGIWVNQGQLSKVSTFRKKYQQYQCKQLPKTRCVCTHYPYINPLSFMFFTKRVYPKLKEYVYDKNIRIGKSTIQVYNFMGSTNRYIQLFAITENANFFQLWYNKNY